MQSVTAGVQQIATFGTGTFAVALFTIALIASAMAAWFSGRGIMPFLTVLVIGGAVFASPQIATTIKSWFG